MGCRHGALAKLHDDGRAKSGRHLEMVKRIMRMIRACFGFLTIGAMTGATIGWFVVNFWIMTTATERFWYPPGRSDTWRLYAVVLGAVVGTAIGMLLEVVRSLIRRRDNRLGGHHPDAD